MPELERTPERVCLLRACQRGAVRWEPTSISVLSPWIHDGLRLGATDPDATGLDELGEHALIQECSLWWVGYYRGPIHHYFHPLPTLVIRWPRRGIRDVRGSR